jgi:hypothetical protein
MSMLGSRTDAAIDVAADRLETFVRQSRRRGGLAATVANAFEGDAAFLRKLKPRLVAARVRHRAPADDHPGGAARAPDSPQLERQRPAEAPPGGGGPSPWLVLGAAFAVGVLTAKAIDWRNHGRTC